MMWDYCTTMPAHSAAIPQAPIRECAFQELEHLRYNPDMAPSDSLLFSNFKNSLRGRRLKDDSELQAAVIEHFHGKTSYYFYVSNY